VNAQLFRTAWTVLSVSGRGAFAMSGRGAFAMSGAGLYKKNMADKQRSYKEHES